MRWFSISELFRQFLETRAPLLFLIGSLALGILGNAVYELLTSTLGATPEVLIGLVITTIIVFTFVAVGLRQVIGELERRRVIGQPAPDRKAEPHAGLILHVGLNEAGAERSIIEWHTRNSVLRHCWLIVTPQVRERAASKLSDLRQMLLERNVTPYAVEVDDALQVDSLYRKMLDVLAEAQTLRSAQPLIADLTGGNKPMTAGMLLACLEVGVTMQYWHVPRDDRGRPLVTQPASAMQIVLNASTAQEANHGRSAA